MIDRFVPNDHYLLCHDYVTDAPYVFLMQPARNLIAQYYAEKYNSLIYFCNDFCELGIRLSKINKTAASYRTGFFIGKINDHAIPIIYVRENHEAALLYFDSQGHKPEVKTNIKEVCCLTLYSVKDLRQTDRYSCAIDAFIFIRDCTAFNEITQEYRIPRLLSYLKSHAKKQDDFFYVTLPNILLKTSQYGFFTQKHRGNTRELIHKNESLEEFRQRYSRISPHGKMLNDYSRKKSIKLAYVVEIQFYLRHLQNKLNTRWTAELKIQFMKQAEVEFTQQGDVFLNPNRQGLYELATHFYQALNNHEDMQLLHKKPMITPSNGHSIQFIAEQLLKIIQDCEYWKIKTLLGLSLPTVINLMQKRLTQLGSSLSLHAKIHAIRDIALNDKRSRGILYLLIGIDDNPIIDEFCNLFTQDWSNTPLFNNIHKDWVSFNTPSQEETVKDILPSMDHYRRVRIRM